MPRRSRAASGMHPHVTLSSFSGDTIRHLLKLEGENRPGRRTESNVGHQKASWLYNPRSACTYRLSSIGVQGTVQ